MCRKIKKNYNSSILIDLHRSKLWLWCCFWFQASVVYKRKNTTNTNIRSMWGRYFAASMWSDIECICIRQLLFEDDVSNTGATLSISDLPALVLVQWLINSKTQRTTILNIKKMLKLRGFFNHMINFRDVVRKCFHRYFMGMTIAILKDAEKNT